MGRTRLAGAELFKRRVKKNGPKRGGRFALVTVLARIVHTPLENSTVRGRRRGRQSPNHTSCRTRATFGAWFRWPPHPNPLPRGGEGRVNRRDLTRRRSKCELFGLALALIAPVVGGLAGAAPSEGEAASVEFFEAKIRPIFAETCFKCHSQDSDKIRGGLLLDSREGLLKGGDTGPAVVPGDVEKSLLIKAVRYTNDDLQMPPKGKKLPADKIADLEKWVSLGAPYPKAPAVAVSAASATQVRERALAHWAFRPVAAPPAPRVRNRRWIQTPIDAFVLAKLEPLHLSPNPQADRRTLLRRATFDLTGLPPTPAEAANFLQDRSPEAFRKVIDRLLASRAYGEKWARHWLDIARYADTKGYVFEEERRYPFAYTYRDWVIQTLNDDLPYDQFLIQQIAADCLELGADKRPLAALGFLTLGRRFLNNTPDIIDDRIDVVTRGTMALTVTCARCHDHKFDPIPTRDYYSLYGIFASAHEPKDPPILGAESLPAEYPAYLKERQKRTNELQTFRQEKDHEFLAKARAQTGDYLLAVFDTQHERDKEKRDSLVRARKLDSGLVSRWEEKLKEPASTNDPVLGPWLALINLPEEQLQTNASRIAGTGAADGGGNPMILTRLGEARPDSRQKLAETYNQIFSNVVACLDKPADLAQAEPASGGATNGPAPAREETGEAELKRLVSASDTPWHLSPGEIERLFDIPTRQKLRALQRKIDELDATHPGTPPRGMTLQENSSPYQPRVFVRGNPNNPGPEVPRQFLEVLSPGNRRPFQDGSGRLELARAIASRDNPLTARVIVNRVWLHHFGKALVRTPSDFGFRSDPPSHPELLDYLASWFMDQGWSLKKLHRFIMLSSVYQQSSEENPRGAEIDPANQWLWKMNRRRLEFEEIRDALLAISGNLDRTAGGRPVEITAAPFSNRRTVYGFIERQNLPGLFRTFDFASPDTTSPQRFYTTVPQQALYLMNNQFLIEQARSLVQRPGFLSGEDAVARINYLYEAAYQRAPGRDELDLGLRFVREAEPRAKRAARLPVWQYGYGFYGNDCTVHDFHPLPSFLNESWQGGKDLPDPALGWVMLNAAGGHPGDARHAAIRRWRAPRDGMIAISGSLNHETDKGDGIAGRIVSSREGELGQWMVRNQKEKTNLDGLAVKEGDTIDFVVESQGSVDSDGFTWNPNIKMTHPDRPVDAWDDPGVEWNAKSDFSGSQEPIAPLNAWEKYAQVLLLSNELVFVD